MFDAAQRVIELNNSLLPTSETYSGAILSSAKISQIFEIPQKKFKEIFFLLARAREKKNDYIFSR